MKWMIWQGEKNETICGLQNQNEKHGSRMIHNLFILFIILPVLTAAALFALGQHRV